MELDDAIREPMVRGHINVCRIFYSRKDRRNPRRVVPLFIQKNQIQYSWGAVAAQCIGLGNANYRVNAMYLEYENVADADDPVTIPTYERGDGIDYYRNLVYTGSRDFLRVPLSLQPSIGIEPGFEDYFTPGLTGNVLTFHTQSQGTAGFNGKPFSAGVNSKIFGVALVATPNFSDQTKDIILARTYFDVSDQTLKMASSQVGVTWDISFL